MLAARPRRTAVLTALALTAVGALSVTEGPTPAASAAVVTAAGGSAGSLVYLKDQRVYVSDVDGSKAHAVTPTSQWWKWPSQSSNGVIAVAGGEERVNPGGTTESSGSSEVYAFDQQGKSLLAKPVETPGSVSGPTAPTYVNHFRISPDGSRVAYNVLGCCGLSGASAFVSPLASGSSDWRDFQDDYIDPDWVNASGDPLVGVADALALTHNGATFGNSEYAVYDSANRNAGDGMGWSGDPAIPDGWGYQAVFSSDVKIVALLVDDTADTGGTTQHVRFHLERLTYTDSNTDLCDLTLPAAEFAGPSSVLDASPTMSPDGSVLAWAQDDGIYEANITSPGDCSAISASVHRVVAGGSMPSFSAAPLAAVKPPLKPVAGFRVSAHPRAKHVVHFNAAPSHEKGGAIVRYRWRFGDGKVGAGRTSSHVYKHSGHYRVTLTVTDRAGHKATVTKKLAVAK